MIIISAVSIFLLAYLPLESELRKSLLENFSQISYIRHNSMENHFERGLEGARSLSSRTVIRNAIIEYENGEIDMANLIAATQPKYEDGAQALKYLVNAKRFVGDTKIAEYTSEDYKNHLCITDSKVMESNEAVSALCLKDENVYYDIMFPIVWEESIIGYDRLIFDLTAPVKMLSTDTIKSKLIYNDEYKDLISTATIVENKGTSCLFYEEGVYYQAFYMQGDALFISKQNENSLLEPILRLSRQILMVGIGILILFSTAVYFFVVQYAKNELVNLEGSRRLLKAAVSEANMDSLTKLGCRRFGEEVFKETFENFQKGASSPAILLFDIDSLKHINDTYGHSGGDKIIRSIAQAVQGNIRSEDVLLRWGGDEFVGIFNGMDKENAMVFANKLLRAVSDLTVKINTKIVNPTISIGISYFKEDDLSFFDAINRADRAMYQSKAEGRNRVHEL